MEQFMSNQAQAGTLYIVSTPIGNDDDISLRALKVIKSAAAIVCEEAREGATLLRRHNISKDLEELNEHNEAEQAPLLISRLQNGESLALISDCGTPLLADPGQILLKQALEAEIPVQVVPGASSILTALVRSGFRADRFVCAGFLSRKAEERTEELMELAKENRTVVLLETPYRLMPMLESAIQVMPERKAYIGCNLTMPFESHHYGTFQELYERFSAQKFKGEFVIVFEHCADGEIPVRISPAEAGIPQIEYQDEPRRFEFIPRSERTDGDEDSGESKPWKKDFSSGGGDRKPWKKDFSSGGGDRKPWKKDFSGGGDRKPWKKDFSSGGGDKPWKKRSDGGEGGGESKPWKKDFSSGGGDKPWKKRSDGGEGGGESKPWKKDFSSGDGDKPWKKRSDGGEGSGERKPWQKRSDGGEGGGERKPWKKDFSSGGGDKPWKKRSDGGEGGGERKPWKKDFSSGGGDKPWKKRSDGGEGGGERKPWKKDFSSGGGDKPWKKGFSKGGDKPWKKKPDGSYRKFDEAGGGLASPKKTDGKPRIYNDRVPRKKWDNDSNESPES
jgi:16S rRNA (cytidine1402-2'-O)-methyltransferase